VAHLPSLAASLDYARGECAAALAAIELPIDGCYAVIHQENGWPRWPLVSDTKRPRLAGRRRTRNRYSDPGSLTRPRSFWFIDCGA